MGEKGEKMRKILTTSLAFGLVIGFASIASATDVPHETGPATGYDRSKDTPTAPGVDLFSVKGSYSLAGVYFSDGNGVGNGVDLTEGVAGGTSAAATTTWREKGGDSFWFHTFITDMVMNVGDNVKVRGQLRFADRNIFGHTNGDASETTPAAFEANLASGRTIDNSLIYMDYDSPIGLFRMGRVPSFAWQGKYLNSSDEGNRIIWWPNFIPKPFTLMFFALKATENDGAAVGSDSDRDFYLAQVEYKTSPGKVALAYYHDRNATLATDTVDNQQLWAFAKYKVANITVEAEMAYAFGESGWNTGANGGAGAMKDQDALAGILDVGAKFGNLSIGGLYFFATGNDRNYANNDAANSDDEAYLDMRFGTGDDFNPYHILTGDYTGILNTDRARITTGYAETATTDIFESGVHSLGVRAAFQVTPKMEVSGIVGGAWADEERAAVQEDSYGVEYDLNVKYKLLDNLVYTAHFGYLDTGDFFEYNGTTGTNNVSTNDITFVGNQIVMSY